MKKIILLLLILTVLVVSLIIGIRKYNKPILLTIQSCDIKTKCEFVTNEFQLQETIDKNNISAWYNHMIFDHASQDFNGLWNIQHGDIIIFGDASYQCEYIETGWSNDGIYIKDGELPKSDLYLCTCKPNGKMYEVIIVGVNRVV